jgi:hypothetical protein
VSPSCFPPEQKLVELAAAPVPMARFQGVPVQPPVISPKQPGG